MTEQLTHHHIVATHAGDKLALYVDGVLAGEQDSFLATIEHWHPCALADDAFGKGFEQVRRRCEHAESEVRRLQTQLTELREAARHPWPGPTDTDATMLTNAADRLEIGWLAGGQLTTAQAVRVLRAVAALVARGVAETPEDDPR